MAGTASLAVASWGCSDRPLREPIDWAAPEDITDNRLIAGCVLLEGGVKCWARQEGEAPLNVQRDDPFPPPPLPFVDFGVDAEVRVVSSWAFRRCVVLASTGVKCWGSNEYYALGVPDPDAVIGDTPDERGEGLPFVDLGDDDQIVGLQGNCALYGHGGVKCWGGPCRWDTEGPYCREGDLAQLGNGDREIRGDDPGEMGDALPYVDLGTDVGAVGLTAGGGHVCVWTGDGRVKCWGKNDRGQLGIDSGSKAIGDDPGEMGDALPFVDLGDDVFVVQVSAGSDHTCALTDKGRTKCWGANSTIVYSDQGKPVPIGAKLYGRLGVGDRDDRVAPLGDALPFVDIGDDLRAVAISAGEYTTCAVVDDGRVKCWGYYVDDPSTDENDNIGDEPGEMGEALPYIGFGTERTVRAITRHAFALLDDGTIKDARLTSDPYVDESDLYGPEVTREELFGAED